MALGMAIGDRLTENYSLETIRVIIFEVVVPINQSIGLYYARRQHRNTQWNVKARKKLYKSKHKL